MLCEMSIHSRSWFDERKNPESRRLGSYELIKERATHKVKSIFVALGRDAHINDIIFVPNIFLLLPTR